MENYEHMILAIDVSTNSVKVGLVSEDLKLVQFNSQDIKVINEDIDGFVKSFDMDDLWNKITIGVKESKYQNNGNVDLCSKDRICFFRW